MKIGILAMGSRGDIQPAAALAARLAARGHQARLVAPKDFEPLGAGRGFAFVGLPFDASQQLRAPEAEILFSGGGSLVEFIRWSVRAARKWVDLVAPAVMQAGEGLDVVVATGFTDVYGGMIGEAQKIPVIHAYWAPMLAAADFSFATFERAPPKMPGFVNRAMYHVFEQAMWLGLRPVLKEARTRAGLPPAGWTPASRAALRRGEPVLLGYSAHVLPPSREWPANVETTGWWRLDAAADWSAPPALVAFLAAGPPPVYVGFGSMAFRDPQGTLEAAMAAVAKAGARAVISAGWGGLAGRVSPAHVFAIDEAPHDWLFPRMAAIVHHGGAGTTGEALRSGKPSVVTPFIVDQFPWARLLQAQGVAPAPIPHRLLTAENLGAALATALGDKTMRARAEALGAKLRAEDGVGRAAEAIERAGANARSST